MQIETVFPNSHLDATAIEVAFEQFCKITKAEPLDEVGSDTSLDRVAAMEQMTRWIGDTKEIFDSRHEFINALREPYDWAHVYFVVGPPSEMRSSPDYLNVELWVQGARSQVSVSGPERANVARLIRVFEREGKRCELPPPPPEVAPPPRVFVGHGGSALWKDIANHLRDLHSYDVEAYETGSRSGHTIRDVLESMLDASSFAVLVMTAEDEQADGTFRARQNVVHEAGLFQGRLGFTRVAILLERGVDAFSNIDGIQYIPFSKGNIRETYGDVLAMLRREFPPA